MLTLSAKIRTDLGIKIKALRAKGILPAVLYGPKIKNLPLKIDLKEFEKIFEEAGESSFIVLRIEGKKKKYEVLIKEIQRNALTGKPIHVDFYQPSLKEKIIAKIPILFEGESLAVKELKGTMVKNLSEIEVKAFPKDIPKEIRADISKLKTFEDQILIGDLKLPGGVEILRDKKEMVAFVSPPTKIEEELEKPIEEKIEEVEVVKKEEKEEEKEEGMKEEKKAE